MKYLILLFLIIGTFSYAKDTKEMKTLKCLYKDVDATKILEEYDLYKKENIENLLYAEKHKDEFFLKALVLDYLYDAHNIDAYYKQAIEKSKRTQKIDATLFYVLYLHKTGQHEKAISTLRGLEYSVSLNRNIPKKVAYSHFIFGIKENQNTKAYLKLKKIENEFIKGEINECTRG